MESPDYAGRSAYHGEIAARYDADRMGEPLWAIEQAYVKCLVVNWPAGAKVLDLPAGTGRFVELLLARGLQVDARDISEDMLKEVRKRSVAKPPQLNIAIGDAERIALPDRSIDYVLCWRLFHLVPLEKIDRILGEFRRVCRGRIVVQVLPVRTGGVLAAAPRRLKRLLRPLRRWLLGSKNTSWSHIPSFVHPERELRRLFARHRLTLVAEDRLDIYDGLPVKVYILEPETAPA